jgi:hypothetical protein
MTEPDLDLERGITDLTGTSLAELSDLTDEVVEEDTQRLLRDCGSGDRLWNNDG